jgi:hypothetical protein
MIGSAADDGNYVREASSPAVTIVEGTLVGDLKKDLTEYRKKTPFDFRSFTANRVEIMRGSQSLVLEKIKGEGENPVDKWRRVSPTPGDLDTAKVEALLISISEFMITSFVDSTRNTGLDSPAMVVSAKFDDTKEEKVSFGASGEDIYVARADDSGAGKVDAAKYKDVVSKFDELLK